MGVRAGTRLIRVVPALAIGAGVLVAVAPGASATGTAATFTLSGAGLSVSEPATATIGSAATGATSLAGSLGTVTVTDQRGALPATWTATVNSTAFTTGGSSQYETVPNTSIAYSSGIGTTTGVGTFTPGLLTSIGTGGTAGHFVGTGNNTAAWNPTITFTLSPSQVAGTYNGTITHSVA